MTDLAIHAPDFLAAYAILFLAASSPGPAVAMLLGIGTTRGRRSALLAASGIAGGSVVLNVGTLVGIGLLLSQAAWAMSAIRLLGAAYLAWLAWGAFRRAASPTRVSVATVPAVSAGRLFLAGFALQVTNPKAIVFWLAIASIGATSGGTPLTVAVFVAGAFAISFLCHATWALLLSSGPVRAGYARIGRWIEGALGAFFAVAAVRLATSRS